MDVGRLDQSPPAELLRRLADERATGRLGIERGDDEAVVWFREGLIYTAAARQARARLGDRLVGAGRISEEQLQATLERQRAEGGRRRIGELLIDSGLIDRDTMRSYVREQIADSVAALLSWREGEYAFVPGEQVDEDVPLDLSVENLLMEGARRLEEWEVIRDRLGSLDAVVDFVTGQAEAELSLTPDEWAMLTRIDGTSSIAEIAQDAGYGQFEAARIIYGLLTAGVVRLVDQHRDEEPVEADEPPSPFAEFYDELADLPPTAPANEQGEQDDRGDLLREFARLDDDESSPDRPGPSAPPPAGRRRIEPRKEPDKPKGGLFGRFRRR